MPHITNATHREFSVCLLRDLHNEPCFTQQTSLFFLPLEHNEILTCIAMGNLNLPLSGQQKVRTQENV